ncbi:MAG: hypothetical protein MI755_12150 [Sphingomonadales bacterium]|nr:hypothetical protein [Sphingomonadales bacterium]
MKNLRYRTLKARIAPLLTHEAGATAMEYAFVIALVGLAALGAFMTFGDSVDNMYGMVTSRVTDSLAVD